MDDFDPAGVLCYSDLMFFVTFNYFGGGYFGGRGEDSTYMCTWKLDDCLQESGLSYYVYPKGLSADHQSWQVPFLAEPFCQPWLSNYLNIN